jgi:type IV secretory pathway VirB6-like protein
MNRSYLFPYRYKKVGMFIFLISFLLLIGWAVWDWSPELFDVKVPSIIKSNLLNIPRSSIWEVNNILDEILSIMAIISGLLWCFSKEVYEDELTGVIRKDSLIWAFYVNYILLILAFTFIYDLVFINVLMLNLFTPIIVFNIRFEWKKYQLKKSAHEE